MFVVSQKGHKIGKLLWAELRDVPAAKEVTWFAVKVGVVGSEEPPSIFAVYRQNRADAVSAMDELCKALERGDAVYQFPKYKEDTQ